MTLAMKIVPRFPARVDGSGPITVTKSNGVYTIAYDLSGLAAFDLDDATTSFITIYDADTETFGKLTIQALIDEIGTNLDPVLASLIGASDGIIVKNGSDIESRTITAPVAGITVSNGDGVAGDPTLALANDLEAVEGLATTGLVRRTGSDAWSAGTQVATAEVADDAITYAKLQNVSATDKLLARVSSGAGNVEEVDFTDFAQSMSAAAAASDARTLLGLTSPATTTPAALTKTDDTNVTLTLGGTPNMALLQATSITVGWTGTLGAARLNGNVVQGVTNDTNVTGSISTQTLTLGWTGTLAVARGGTGASTESGARTALGLAIGSDVQAYSARLTTVAGYTPTKGKLLVGDGTNWNELPVGTNDYVLTADSIQSLGMLWKAAPGSGGGLSDAYDQFTDGTNVADASGGDTFKFRAGTGVTVTVQSNDGTHGDNLLIALNTVLTAFAGVTVAADKLIYGNGTNTFGTSDLTAAGRNLLDDATAADQRTTLGVGTSDSPQFTGVNIGHASDTTLTRSAAGRLAVEGVDVALLGVEDQTLTGGTIVTSKSLGTITTGTVTPDPGDRPLQHYTNGGAHTLAPSSNTGSILLDITNDGSAGTVTTSGFTKVSGDSFTTTNGHKFRCHISIGNGGSLLQVQAMQ